MKIADILAKKEVQQPQPEVQQQKANQDADMLRRQREQIEREQMERQLEEMSQKEIMDRMPEPPRPQQITDPMPPQEYQGPTDMPEPMELDTKKKYRMSIFLDNGQKLPIVFEAHPLEVIEIMEKIDLKIECGRVITMGEFKFPGNKVLYIDLEGR